MTYNKERPGMLPQFPLERLAPELQMLILCKCDLTSIRYLVSLNSNFRSLFLQHPNTYLRDIFRELPGRLGDFLSIIWIIDTFPQEHLRWYWTTHWLGTPHSAEKNMLLHGWIDFRADHLTVLYELADIMEEVDEIVKMYSESVLAILDTVSEPSALHSTIPLSPIEYERIAGAFLLLRMYTKHRRLGGRQQTFMDALPVWQVEQMLTVTVFLEGPTNITQSDLYYLVDQKYGSRKFMCDASLYAWNYSQVAPYQSPSFLRHRQPTILTQIRTDAEPSPGEDTLMGGQSTSMAATDHGGSFDATSFTNVEVYAVLKDLDSSYGWKLFCLVSLETDISMSHYEKLFLHLGLLFWEEDRFLHIRMTSVSEYQDLVARFKEVCCQIRIDAYDNSYRDGSGMGDSPFIKFRNLRLRPDHIIGWTRSDVQCTFGEWMVRSGSYYF